MAGTHTYLTISGQTLDDLAALLKKMPGDIREKMLKAAIKSGTAKFQKEAKLGVGRIKSRKKDRWGKPQNQMLRKSIRRRISSSNNRTIGTVLTVGPAAIYAASVEYGHEKWVFGERLPGDVEESKFWRPAIDKLKPVIERMIVEALRKGIKKFHA